MLNLNIQTHNSSPPNAIVSTPSNQRQETIDSQLYKSLIRLGVTPHPEWKESLPFIGTAKLEKMHDSGFLSDLRSYMLETGIMQKKSFGYLSLLNLNKEYPYYDSIKNFTDEVSDIVRSVSYTICDDAYNIEMSYGRKCATGSTPHEDNGQKLAGVIVFSLSDKPLPKNSKTIFSTPEESVSIKKEYKTNVYITSYPESLLENMSEISDENNDADLIIFTGDRSKLGGIIHASPNCTDGNNCIKHEDRCIISFDAY